MELSRLTHIVFLGSDGYPCGFAEIQRLRLLAKSLVEAGCKVMVINRLWILGQCPENFTPQVSGTFEGIQYVFATGVTQKPDTFIKRNLRRLLGVIVEIMVLRRIMKEGKVDGAIISIDSFWEVVYYKILSWVFSFPIILGISELFTAIYPMRNPLARLDAWVMDRFAFRVVNGNIPINEFLVQFIKKYAPTKPYLKVPVLVDFSRYNGMMREPKEKYLLFCGSLAYLEVIQFILRAFDLCHTSDEIFLYLVVNGSHQRFSELDKSLSEIDKKRFVRIFSKLTDAELSRLYLNAYALLVPIRPSVQDHARFPHKIGEYCASGRPIVTTNYGDIRSYFLHGKTAFIAKYYDEEEYARTITEVLDNTKFADEVGINGKLVAANEFDYKIYGERIKEFIQSLKC